MSKLAITSAVAGSRTAEVLVYRTPFPNDSGANKTLGTTTWKINLNATGNSLAGTVQVISSGAGRGPTMPINTSSTEEAANGFLYLSLARTAALMYTTEYLIARGKREISKASFYMGNADAVQRMAFAIRISTQWYITAEDFNSAATTAANFPTQAGLFTFLLDLKTAGKWKLFTLTTGVTMGPGAVVNGPLPEGDINAFGLYNYRSDGTSSGNAARVDTLEIYTKAK